MAKSKTAEKINNFQGHQSPPTAETVGIALKLEEIASGNHWKTDAFLSEDGEILLSCVRAGVDWDIIIGPSGRISLTRYSEGVKVEDVRKVLEEGKKKRPREGWKRFFPPQ